MPKKIKKRTKKKDEEVLDEGALVVAEGEGQEAEFSDDDFAGPEGEFDEVETFGDIVVDIPDHERDRFQEASYKAANWVEDNRPAAIGIFIAICLLPVLAYAGYHYMDQQKVATSEDVSKSLALYQNPVKGGEAMKFFEQNDKFKAPETVYPSYDAKWKAIYDQASKGLNSANSGELSVAAKYMKAAAAYQTGKFDEAVTLYQEVLQGAKGRPIAPVATLALAMSQAGKKDIDGAVSTLDKLAEMDKEYQAMAIYHKGRVLESAGKKKEAKDAYHKLLEVDPKTTYKSDIERRIATL